VAAPEGVKCVTTQRAASNASARSVARPDGLDAALSLPEGMTMGGRYQNRSLCYQRLERPAHRVSGVSQNARYLFLLM